MMDARGARAVLSEAQRRQWEDEGYLLLKGAIPPAVITQVRGMFARVVDGMIAKLKTQGLITEEGRSLPFERRFAEVAGEHAARLGRSWRKALCERETYDLHYTEPLVSIAAELLGSDVIAHPVFNGRPKLPGQQVTVVPWHQDSSYFGQISDRSCILTCWIPLVPVDADNGCLQILPGYHKGPLLRHREEDRDGKFLEVDPALLDESKAITCPMQPGDVLVFSNLTMHRSLPSTSPTIRWSIDIRYLRDGDHPGTLYWPHEGDHWIVKSKTRPPTSYAEWQRMTADFPW